jgi:hypothetical protein
MADSAWRACHVQHFEHLPFMFFLSPLNEEKFMKNNRKKKHVYDGKFLKIHIVFLKKTL